VVDGHEYRIEATDITVQTENRAGLLAATEGDLTVAVETLLTEELTYEGLAREFVNRVQNMRKEAKFEVTDRIHIWLTASAPFLQAVERMRDYVSNETLCESLRYNETGGTHQKEWKIDEESISVGIARI